MLRTCSQSLGPCTAPATVRFTLRDGTPVVFCAQHAAQFAESCAPAYATCAPLPEEDAAAPHA